MTNLKISSFVISATLGKSFYIANAEVNPDDGLLEQYERQDYYQRFAWFPEAVSFFPIGESATFWIEIFLDTNYVLDPDVDYAVLLPFFNKTDNPIEIGGGDNGETILINLSKGIYKLIYQERYLTQAEIDQFPEELPPAEPEEPFGHSFGPKLCHLTFISTLSSPAPEILRPPRDRDLKTLFLHN